jgi:hypothetical protein
LGGDHVLAEGKHLVAPSGYDCDTSDARSLAEVGWDDLTGPEDLFLTLDWMRAIQATADTQLWYLSTSRAGRPMAGLATALAGTDAPWALGRPDTLLDICVQQDLTGSREVANAVGGPPVEVLMPALVCGGRHIGRTRVLLDPHAGPDEVHALIDRAQELAQRVGARCLCFPYVDERDTLLRSVLQQRGFYCHVSGEYASLDVPAGGYAGYLATLSQHRAQRIRADRRRLAAVGVEYRFEPLIDCDIDRLAELETQLMVKHGLSSWQFRHSAAALHAVADALGSRAMVSLARHEDVTVGFGLLLTHRDQWFAHRTGFDYQRKQGLPLYFELLYHRPIELASQYGITTIHYGVGSIEAKRSRGCSTTTQYSYLRWNLDEPGR